MNNLSKEITTNTVVLLGMNIWIAVIACFPDYLMAPPHWDSITGSFREALWLLDNNFNYRNLAFQEPGYAHLGPRTYFFSWYPLLIAQLYALLELPQLVFILVRIINLFAYLLLGVALASLASRLNLSTLTKLGLVLAIFLHPLCVSQAFSLNIEILIATVTMLSIMNFCEGKLERAVIWMLLAVGLKPTALVGALFLILADQFMLSSRQCAIAKRLQRLFWVGLPLYTCLIFQVIEWKFFYLPGRDGAIFSPFALITTPTLMLNTLSLLTSSPDALFLLIFCASLAVVQFPILLVKGRLAQKPKAPFVIQVCCMISLLWLGFLASLELALPRYLLTPLGFMLLTLFWLIDNTPRMRHYLALLPALVFSMNLHGDIYSIIGFGGRTNDGHILESTLRYMEQVKMDQDLFRVLDELPEYVKIYMFRPLLFSAQDPRFGYSVKPREKVISALFVSDPDAICTSGILMDQSNIFSKGLVRRCAEARLTLNPRSNALLPYVLFGPQPLIEAIRSSIYKINPLLFHLERSA